MIIDLNKPGTYSVVVAPPESEEDAKARRANRRMLIAGVVFIDVMVVITACVMVLMERSPEMRDFFMLAIGVAVSGLTGLLIKTS